MRAVVVESQPGHKLLQHIHISSAPHIEEVPSDEPRELGGSDLGLTPFELVLAGLGSCKSMTVRLYAERKGWPLEAARVTLSGSSKPGQLTIEAALELVGPLTEEQRIRLLEIADKCPVHRALTGTTTIATKLS